MREFLLVLGVLCAALGLRSFAHPWLRRSGSVLMLGVTYLAVWVLTANHLAAGLAVAGWLFLPWLEILTRIRHLRLPLDRPLKSTFPPSAGRFPQLREMTEEIEESGFKRIEDASFEWDGSQQFMRLFYHAESRTQAAILLLEQVNVALAWVSLSSRLPDGRTWTSWNYPFSHTMMLAPETQLNVVLEADSFEALLSEHQNFLIRNGLEAKDLAVQEPDDFAELIRRETRRQVDHNLDRGLITLSGEGTFRYSWRGYLFLWRQFLRDMVRLS